jgi:predicted metal-dependent hydrolase
MKRRTKTMPSDTPYHDPRYLAGILLFNEGDFFEAHEVWESVWMDAAGDERKIYQGLIQAAVGLLHFGNGNLRGAVKLYQSAHDYMKNLPTPFLGLHIPEFWLAMERCFHELLQDQNVPGAVVRDESLLPEIHLDPPPESWPDPAEFVEEN